VQLAGPVGIAEQEPPNRIREVALGAGEDFILIFTPEGNRYDSLIRN